MMGSSEDRFWHLSQRVRLTVYGMRSSLRWMHGAMGLLVTISVLVVLLYTFGFPTSEILSPETLPLIYSIQLGYFIYGYFAQYVLALFARDYFRKNVPEGIFAVLALVCILSYVFDLPYLKDGGYVAFKILLWIGVSFEMARRVSLVTSIPFSASTLFVWSFIGLITVGTLLLMMPNITVSGVSMSFFDALFMAISAGCVTGLSVVEVSTHFSTKGHFVLMILIQLGGLNMISFATLFSFFLSGKMRLKYQILLKKSLDVSSASNTLKLFRKIIILAFSIELAGAVFIFFTWENVPFESYMEQIFYSVFHAVSAFNNAGFSLFGGGFLDPVVRYDYGLHMIIAGLIFFGSIGFPTLRELFSKRTALTLIGRSRFGFEMNSKLVLKTSLMLIFLGAFLFFVLEYRNLGDQGFWALISDAVFQSVTTRTAGFNTVDIGELSAPTLMMMMLWMFIGAASGSTGGGVKVITVVVLFLAAYSILRGKRHIEYGQRNIPFRLFNRASIVFLLSSCFVFFGVWILTIFEPDISLIQLFFEEISAFATVGLSTGITSDLSFEGRMVIMISMFLGRVGIVTLGFSLLRQVNSSGYEYPEEEVQVG